jgi:hypothetical protein
LRQNFFGFLIRCATERDLHTGLVLQISLEIIWMLTFNNKIHQILIKDYDNFVMYLKTTLINSNEQGVQAAAKGILWKLENESILKQEIIDKNENNICNETYDIMISYCHSNKDLCFQIHQHLTKLNYRIWLDFENMYGSTLQSMAQAIESSNIILICMSNPYKQSAYCRSEAEYAYTRQRHLIPLVMEKKYRPDGWLGFICASKMYVDFTKTEFEQAFQKLISQIQLHQKQIESISSPLTNNESIIQNNESLPPVIFQENIIQPIEQSVRFISLSIRLKIYSILNRNKHQPLKILMIIDILNGGHMKMF